MRLAATCRTRPWAASVGGVRAGAWLPLVVALLLGATGWWVASGMLHHDCALYLYFTDRYLDGGRLYVDILELNPPLAFWLTVPPVWLARSLGLAPEPVFVAYIAALAGLALLLTHRLCEGLPALPPARRRLFLLAAAILLVPGAVGIFGQREHLLALFVLPYLLLVARRASGCPAGWAGAVGIGLLAAVGLLLKPYYLCLPLALEIYLLALTRRWRAPLRPETIALAAGGVLYVAAVAVFTPAYLDTVMPMLAATYDAYKAPLVRVLAAPDLLWLVPATVVFLLALRRGVAGRPLPSVLLIAAACYVVAYLVQQKGWFYQLYPVPVALGLWFAVSVLHAPGERVRGIERAWRTAAPVGAAGIAATLILRGPYSNGYVAEVRQVLAAQDGEARSLFAFSAQVSIGFPAVLSERLAWASRFPHLWPLPAAVAPRGDGFGKDAALDRARHYVVDAVVADLAEGRPDLILVDRRDSKTYFTGPFDYLAFFLADPRFAALWQHYEPAGQTAHFSVFRRRS